MDECERNVKDVRDVLQAILEGVSWIHYLVGDATSVTKLMVAAGDVMRDRTEFSLYQVLGYTTVLFELLAIGEHGDDVVTVLPVYFRLLESFVVFANKKSRLAKRGGPHGAEADDEDDEDDEDVP